MKLTVTSDAQAVLFERFIRNEISAGVWKNIVPKLHEHPWVNTKVVVQPPAGRDFDCLKSGYNLLRLANDPDKALVMRAALYYAKTDGRISGMALKVDPKDIDIKALDEVFSHDDLLAELRLLRKTMKHSGEEESTAPEDQEAAPGGGMELPNEPIATHDTDTIPDAEGQTGPDPTVVTVTPRTGPFNG